MSAGLNREELVLLKLLRLALAEEPAPPPDGNLDQILAMAKAHAVLPLLYPVLEGQIPRERYAPAAEICVGQYYQLLFLTRFYVETLAAKGIPTVVLKGPGAALAYPTPEYRKSGDIDLLLLDRDALSPARAAILSTGAVEEAEQHANHHVSFRTPDGIVLELHVTMTEDFDNRTVNDYLVSLQDGMRDHVTERELLPGVILPLPDTPYQAFSLLIHMLQHFLRAGFGLKLLCDWTAFWNRRPSEEDRDAYLHMIRACGLEGFSSLVSAVCVRYLGMAEALPIQGSEDLCEDFLTEILEAEEFGKTASERMVMVRGGLWGYVREFHHQTLLNFPRVGRYFPLWPILWGITLVRFLYNNRVIRKTSLTAVLRETRRRSRLMEPLGLFETKE